MSGTGSICFTNDLVVWILDDLIVNSKNKFISRNSPNFKFKNIEFSFLIYLFEEAVCTDQLVTVRVVKIYKNDFKYCTHVVIAVENGVTYGSKWSNSNTHTFRIFINRHSFSTNKRFSVFCTIRPLIEPERRIPDCQILLKENATSSGETKVAEIPKSKGATKILKTLEEFLVTGLRSDVILKVGDKEFKAHKFVLGMRSPVFSSMLSHDMQEKLNGVVQIKDCDEDSFSDFLRFLYTGHLEHTSVEKALLLYKTAHKYQLQELKEECVEYARNNLTVEAFCDALMLSLLYEEKELNAVITQFFLSNASEIVVKEKWEMFMAENTSAANHLIIELAKQNMCQSFVFVC